MNGYKYGVKKNVDVSGKIMIFEGRESFLQTVFAGSEKGEMGTGVCKWGEATVNDY
jgi:hypothetical protein